MELAQDCVQVGTKVVEIAGGWNWLRIVFIVGLGTEDVEPLDSATRVLVLCRDISCGDDRWMTMAQDRVHWQALALTMLNL